MKVFKVASAPSKLTVVATPIGNMQEISARALEELQSCDLVLCEDTRVTGKLLSHLKLKKPLVSIGSVDESASVAKIEKYLDGSQKLVLVSDAGYPGLSDPGVSVIREAYAKGVAVEVINGPSAVIHALVVSGFWLNEFFYAGFLPAKTRDRQLRLAELAEMPYLIVFFETPHRIVACLKDLVGAMPGRRIAVCRELTKMHETIYLGLPAELVSEVAPRGEFVVVIGPKATEESAKAQGIDRQEVFDLALKAITNLVNEGKRVKDACLLVSGQTGLKSKDLYSAFVKLK